MVQKNAPLELVKVQQAQKCSSVKFRSKLFPTVIHDIQFMSGFIIIIIMPSSPGQTPHRHAMPIQKKKTPTPTVKKQRK